MKIIFCGDIVIGEKHIKTSQRLLNEFQQSDYRICNLEGAICVDGVNPIVKAGPHVSNDESCLQLLRELDITHAALANNHIMDYGIRSLENTVVILRDNCITPFGASTIYDNVYRSLVIADNAEKICIMNACQAEFGVTKSIRYGGGYAWVNAPQFLTNLRENIDVYDKVILFIHAGMEDQIIPLPEWKQVYHNFADVIRGRGVIIATHPHIMQGYEVYRDTPIYYSLGNFSFYNENKIDEIEWNRGLVVRYDSRKNSTDVIYVAHHNGIIDIDDREESRTDFKYRSEIICDDDRLNEMADNIAERCWKDFYRSYYESLSSVSNIRTVKDIVKFIINKIMRHHSLNDFNETMLLHNIQIESHRWCVERYLYNKNVSMNNKNA